MIGIIIALAAVLLLILAARKRRRGGRLVVWPVSGSLALSTLANNTVLQGTLWDIADDAYLISADLTVSGLNMTATEGPISVGVSSNSLNAAQVLEALEASPTNRGDRVAIEQAGRPVREIADLSGVGTEEVANDGKPIRVKLRMPMNSAQILEIFARNKSGATLTTGTVVRVDGKIYGRWA